MRYMGFVRTAALLLEQNRQKKEAENAKDKQEAESKAEEIKVSQSATNSRSQRDNVAIVAYVHGS